jgi:parallel beta-helix repeat protein
VGEILVENNTVYGNGSAGIESFRTNGAVITENTVYGNNTANVLQTASVDEIFINQSNNDTVTNNITTAPDLTPPTISSLTESPSSGDLNAGKTVTFTLNLNEAVTVAGGTPTLTLNDGGVATYAGGSDMRSPSAIPSGLARTPQALPPPPSISIPPPSPTASAMPPISRSPV